MHEFPGGSRIPSFSIEVVFVPRVLEQEVELQLFGPSSYYSCIESAPYTVETEIDSEIHLRRIRNCAVFSS